MSNPGSAGSFQRPNTFQQPHQPMGGFNQQPHYNQGARGFSQGGMHAPQQPHWNNQPHFTSGNSFGSPSRASNFKTALAGAAVGTIGEFVRFVHRV